ncbi:MULTISPECIES: SurA N-terminal domain-containing protein [unclassified Devosia]|jgi:peptidyl-prolyl cis-trans isomerase SurA|uniref:SurA N-terminal domain-containing protein n=1 Tax=unclassified Devosia TaxID=196773 RepID=UPI001553A151|nr:MULTISPECIES: SurA N-terminal domain-containing protein [unclassified Devosia]
MAVGNLARAAGAVMIGALMSFGLAMPSLAANVKVTVNGTPITDVQIAQRVKLFAIEGNKTGQRGATEQLIDEAIQMQEAERLGIEVSGAQVDEGILQIARNTKLSQDKLIQMLQQSGVNIDTLRDRLEAAIAWNGVTQAAIMPQVQISDLALDQQAASKVAAYQSFDYILKEIIFVAPGGQGAGARTAQANRYRSSFSGCDSAVELSLGFTDAAVIDVGRRHATQLPEAIAKELAGLNAGGITKPRVVETGVSMLAVCQKTQAEDLTFIKGDLRAEAGSDALKGQVETYLADLRKRAKIIYN